MMLGGDPAGRAVSLSNALLKSGKSIYLGSDNAGPIFGSAEDHLLVVGPPRSGKSSGLFAPTIACHPGPAVVVSIRHDLVQDTGLPRRAIAKRFGGIVAELKMPGTETYGAFPLGWRISDGCENWITAKDRAVSLAYTAVPPSNGDTFWRESVAVALAGCLHGAALLGHRDEQLVTNIRTANLDVYRNAVEVLDPERLHASSHSFSWLYNDKVMTENTRRSLLAVLSSQVLGAFDYADRGQQPPVDIAGFVRSWGTLYITIPYERKNVLAPLITAFVEGVIAAWRSWNRSSTKVKGTLLLALDEVANIAPLPSLPGIVTTGAGDRIQAVLGLQGPGQANAWGDQSDTVISGTSLVAIFPGLRAHDYVKALTDASEQSVAYTPSISVTESLPPGDRYATGERLTQERLFMEAEVSRNSKVTPHLARLRAARVLAAKRREDGLRTREDEVNTPHGVLNEIMSYTDAALSVERRPSFEPSDLTHRPRGEITLVSGAKLLFLQVRHWSQDTFWRPILQEEEEKKER